LAIDHRGLRLRFILGDSEAEDIDIGYAIDELNDIRRAFANILARSVSYEL
jgi:hypothetical protein